MINSEITKITGTPLNASEGKLTQSVAVSGPGDLGMGEFNPRKGANTHGKYMVDGVNDPYKRGTGPSRSSLRSAGGDR